MYFETPVVTAPAEMHKIGISDKKKAKTWYFCSYTTKKSLSAANLPRQNRGLLATTAQQ